MSAILPPNPLINPQPSPLNSSGIPVVDLVIKDLSDRKAFGIAKYGTALQANNGRNNLIDVYQEVLDMAIYIRCQIEEHWTEPFELW
jgi:hypothetical protein